MAIHHLTPPIRGGERPRLPSSQTDGVLRTRRDSLHNTPRPGSERSSPEHSLGGPVTQAIRAMRAAEPIIPVWNNAAGSPDPDRQRIRDLRRRIAERIESDIALLDLLDGDCDIEEDDPPGGDVCDEPHDPEEDAGDNEPESAAFLCQFNGYGYFPVIRRRGA